VFMALQAKIHDGARESGAVQHVVDLSLCSRMCAAFRRDQQRRTGFCKLTAPRPLAGDHPDAAVWARAGVSRVHSGAFRMRAVPCHFSF